MTITYTFSFQWVIKKRHFHFLKFVPSSNFIFFPPLFWPPYHFSMARCRSSHRSAKILEICKAKPSPPFWSGIPLYNHINMWSKMNALTLKKEKLEFAVWCRVLCSECSPIPCCRNAKSKLHQNYVKPLVNRIMTTILILYVIYTVSFCFRLCKFQDGFFVIICHHCRFSFVPN